MLRNSESETEILLGNKQLLGIFFVVAVLLGVAFASGYMVGRGSGKKSASASDVASAASSPPAGGETHSVSADTPAESIAGADSPSGARADHVASASPKRVKADPAQASEEPPLGSPNRKGYQAPHDAPSDVAPLPATSNSAGNFSPKEGQTFLQVAAVGRDEAEAVADVLHKKGFRAHAVPKPGSPKIFRVLIGPIRDPSDLSSTRDSLRKTGFREVIVQRYQAQ